MRKHPPFGLQLGVPVVATTVACACGVQSNALYPAPRPPTDAAERPTDAAGPQTGAFAPGPKNGAVGPLSPDG